MNAFTLFALIVLNAFFVACEFALVKIRLSQLDELEEQGNRSARLARRVVTRLDASLAATQLGITVCSLLIGWLGTPYVAGFLAPGISYLGITSPAAIEIFAFSLSLATLTFLHVVLGELVPKLIATRKPVGATLLVSYPLAAFCFLLRPVLNGLNTTTEFFLRHIFRLNPSDSSELAHSEEELRQIVCESGSTEEVSPIGRELLINALDMSRRVTRDIMTPRGQVVSLDIEDSFEDNLSLALETRHTRFPLCEGHLDKALGLVHIKDLLAAVHSNNRDLLAIKRELLPVSELMPLESLLKFFLGRRAHLALVIDEFGDAVGIVTLDNVLAELVGDIHDEFDLDQPEFIRLSENEFVVAGTLGLYELQEYSDLAVESSEVSTVGGYVVHLLGHLPKVGETVEVEHYLVTVTKTDGRSVSQLHFRRSSPVDADTADNASHPPREQLSE